MKKIVLIVLIAACLPLQSFAQASRAVGQALKVVITILTGAAASKAAAETTDAYQVVKQKDALLESLRSQGMTLDQPAIYSLYFSLNNDASAVKWADIIGWPDVFTLIQMQGMGESIVPAISYEYRGQPLQTTFVHTEVPAGRRILIHFLDDDTTSNEIWNNVLSTKVDFTISAQGKTVLSTMLIDAKLMGSGQIQLVQKNLTIDASDYIATAELTVPETPDGHWVANGKIYDGKNREVGTMQFAQIWRPLNSPAGLQQIGDDRAKAHKRMVFWGGIGIACAIVFGGLVLSNWKGTKTKPGEPPTTPPTVQ